MRSFETNESERSCYLRNSRGAREIYKGNMQPIRALKNGLSREPTCDRGVTGLQRKRTRGDEHMKGCCHLTQLQVTAGIP